MGSVRIGFGCGTRGGPVGGAELRSLATAVEEFGFDSLWLSERITGDVVDPVVGLAFVAAITARIKLGTSVMVLPGRNPAVVAKQLASLDRLCDGRLLPAFGLGAPVDAERQAFGGSGVDRVARLEEALPLLRRLWAEASVDHDGPLFPMRGVGVRPLPERLRFDVWLGGRSTPQLERTGRLADGWLASFVTPEEAGAGRRTIEAAAARCGRVIDPGHFGSIVLHSRAPLTDAQRAAVAAARRGAPEVDAEAVVATGVDVLRQRLDEFVAHGITKFVLVPIERPPDWREEVGTLATEVLDLQRRL